MLVVGASEGIGREFAELAVAAGARVVIAARRPEALADVVVRAGGGHVVAADVTDDASLDALVDEAVAHLGEIDLVMYAVGSATLRHLIDSDRHLWERTMAANVIGFNEVARRAVPAMARGGIIVALSSETAGVPRDGLVAYAASKAALDISVVGWQVEQPQVRWSCVAVGATFPTAFGATFDADLTGQMMELWIKRGLLTEEFMAPEAVAQHLLAIYASALTLPSVNVEHIMLRSPSPTIGTRPAARPFGG